MWIITAWDELTGRGTITSAVGEIPFDETVVQKAQYFDGFWPGDRVDVKLRRSGTGYAVTSLRLLAKVDDSLLLAAEMDLIVVPRHGDVLALHAKSAAGTRWLLFFGLIDVDVPPSMNGVARLQWDGWDELGKKDRARVSKRLGVDAEQIGGEIVFFAGANGGRLGHVLFVDGHTVWRRPEPPPEYL